MSGTLPAPSDAKAVADAESSVLWRMRLRLRSIAKETSPVSIVEQLLAASAEDGFRTCSDSHRFVLSVGTDVSEGLGIRCDLPRPVFRAVVARLFGLCESAPGAVRDPYRGTGTITAGAPPRAIRLDYVNLPAEQSFALQPLDEIDALAGSAAEFRERIAAPPG